MQIFKKQLKLITLLMLIAAMLVSAVGCIKSGELIAEPSRAYVELFNAVSSQGSIEKAGTNSAWGAYEMKSTVGTRTLLDADGEHVEMENIAFEFTWDGGTLEIRLSANRLEDDGVYCKCGDNSLNGTVDSIEENPKVSYSDFAYYEDESCQSGTEEYNSLVNMLITNVNIAMPIIDDFVRETLDDASLSAKDLCMCMYHYADYGGDRYR